MRDTFQTLVVELCQLTPEQLDGFVLTYPHPLPYSSQMYARDIESLADTLLKHESLGDALARVQSYAVTL